MLKENFDKILAPVKKDITPTSVSIYNHKLKVGFGVHDSSAALIPYVFSNKTPFALISTGTWSISMCPSNNQPLTSDELKKDCLQFMNPKGSPVKASRLFLGQELREQAKKVGKFFNMPYHQYKDVLFDESFVPVRNDESKLIFQYNYLNADILG